MFTLTVATNAVLALTMVNSSIRKATGDESSEQLRRRLEVKPNNWRTVGFLELLAGIGLLVGLAIAPLGVAAAAGVAAVMVGAVVLHVRVGRTGAPLAAPVAVLVIGATAGVLRLITM